MPLIVNVTKNIKKIKRIKFELKNKTKTASLSVLF